ncbi:MAG: polysaccharide pyruvyl transferase family protein [Planctomycetota bacterium]
MTSTVQEPTVRPLNDTATPKICFFGASNDTGNLGVSALWESVLVGLLERLPGAQVTVFDNSYGVRPATIEINGRQYKYTRIGGRNSKRYHRHDSLTNIRFCCRFGGLGNPGSRAILDADAIVDISGGDSFTDLYGPKRFRAVVLPKQIALEQRRPLIFLPQTYGPFQPGKIRDIARTVLGGAAMAWARDERSFEQMQELLGDQLDAERHRCGVDVAFQLKPRAPKKPLPAELQGWLASSDEVVGFNVSGLVYTAAQNGENPYGFKADYLEVVHRVLEQILAEGKQKLLLVPHVIRPGQLDCQGVVDCDLAACERVASILEPKYPGRVAVLPPQTDAGEIKHVISRLDWFCGTRMHATIAGLSSGVPTATVSYSYKAQGVFESCGQGERVADPRQLDTEATIANVMESWHLRDEAKASLAQHLPAVIETATAQLDAIAHACCGQKD